MSVDQFVVCDDSVRATEYIIGINCLAVDLYAVDPFTDVADTFNFGRCLNLNASLTCDGLEGID